jgi:hypothetical protein
MRGPGWAILLLLVSAAVPLPALEIQVDPPVPVQGRAATVRILEDGNPAAGVTIRATYRPNSEVMDTVTVGRTNSAGEVTWVPADAGMVELRASRGEASASRAVSVRFRRAPLAGILVFLLAGLILFGGNARFIRAVMTAPPREGVRGRGGL